MPAGVVRLLLAKGGTLYLSGRAVVADDGDTLSAEQEDEGAFEEFLFLAAHGTGDVVALRALLPVNGKLMQYLKRFGCAEPSPIQAREGFGRVGLFYMGLEVFDDVER
ncbi:hypothetical protein EOA23_06075 [Mesorhizobium sp. M2A.F.Ca.ET.042.01.1.1]|uniref:hypothetical protein n=1 Tax=Mesorhizobium sp. M2A.F.Ca.ET.042.01.1.1 TaxID=2496745 RepID=UPI000FC9CFAD|nr:hypothetical protein [Mesorhizobium sp. M2A.F.Ca.ET.042.01.1.1]RUX33562.1 hypothetical protein EOA23_06075 [Mesorhizobium sp. M2A.F.Ca.ET.042.01.1.1]